MNALNSAKEKIRVSFKTVTDPVRRRLGTAAFVGVIAGIFGGIVKFGWEVPFPPRTPNAMQQTRPKRFWRCLGSRQKSRIKPTHIWVTICHI